MAKAQELKVGGRTYYLNNKDLLAELKISNQRDVMTDPLASMLRLLVSRYAKKGNWSGYSFNEDMQGYALLMLMQTWRAFNVDKGSNPFAFFTQCVKHSFIQFLNKEKHHRNIRDKMLILEGEGPSFGYKEEED